jgi:hypothetical protein
MCNMNPKSSLNTFVVLPILYCNALHRGKGVTLCYCSHANRQCTVTVILAITVLLADGDHYCDTPPWGGVDESPALVACSACVYNW